MGDGRHIDDYMDSPGSINEIQGGKMLRHMIRKAMKKTGPRLCKNKKKCCKTVRLKIQLGSYNERTAAGRPSEIMKEADIENQWIQLDCQTKRWKPTLNDILGKIKKLEFDEGPRGRP